MAPVNDKGLARAALWIAYLQLALISVTGVIAWGLFQQVAHGFQHDALVQRFLRESDEMRTLDPGSAQEAELTAQNLVEQLVASEGQVLRQSDDGSYTCQLNQLLQAGSKGATDAEKRDFAIRLRQSPYMFRISDCSPSVDGKVPATYILTAVPLSPRMPGGSAIYCADQTGVVRQVRAGTSLDCLKDGQPLP